MPFPFLRRPNNPPPSATADTVSEISQLTYAIGDIHGRDDLFEGLIAKIKDDAENRLERPRLVLLGDYVDRGPQSFGVIERILAIRSENWCDLVALAGNHELFMLRFLADPDFGANWRRWGGGETMRSYGVEAPLSKLTSNAWKDLRDRFAAAVPQPHLDLLTNAKFYFQAGDYVFVHAGIEPGLPLEEQNPDTMVFVRDPFLESEKAGDFVVVHGHTPSEQVQDKAWRIGLDTGAYFSDILSAVRLKGPERSIMNHCAEDTDDKNTQSSLGMAAAVKAARASK